MRKIKLIILNNNALWAVIAVIINCAINFTIVPYVTERVGVEAYGFVTLSNILIIYVDVVSVALNAFASRFIAIEYHKKNYEKASMYFTSIFLANTFLCIILLLLCSIFISNVHLFLNISEDLQHGVKVLLTTVMARYFCVLLRNAFDVSTFIQNRLDLTEKLRAFSYILQAVILAVTCSILQPQIWYIGFATLVAAAFLLLTQIICSIKYTPELKLRLKLFSPKHIKSLLMMGIWNSINNLGNLLNSGLDLLIANKMLTELIMGMISVSKTLGSLCYTVVLAISNSFRPEQLRLYSINDMDTLIDKLKQSMKITGAVCGIIIAGFMTCGYEFIELWLPTQNHRMIYNLSIIVLMSDVMIGVVSPLYYVFTLTKKLKLPCFITIGMGVINIISMFFLIKYTSYGDYAVVLTTMILNFVHFFDTPLYSAYCLKKKWYTFYPVILKHFINCIVLILCMNWLNVYFISITGWISLLIKVVLYGMVGVLVSFMILTTSSEKMIIFNKLLNRKREGNL